MNRCYKVYVKVTPIPSVRLVQLGIFSKVFWQKKEKAFEPRLMQESTPNRFPTVLCRYKGRQSLLHVLAPSPFFLPKPDRMPRHASQVFFSAQQSLGSLLEDASSAR